MQYRGDHAVPRACPGAPVHASHPILTLATRAIDTRVAGLFNQRTFAVKHTLMLAF
jgi:hypothetical protein